MRMRWRAGISLRGSRCSVSGLRSSALCASSFFVSLTNLTYWASVDIDLLLAERHAEGTQQLPRLVVVVHVGDEGHVHALHEGDLVRVDLREDALLGQAHAVVAVAVEALGV